MGNTIVIKTQSDYDNLPMAFNSFTHIEIRTEECIKVKSTPGNSIVTVRGSSTVEAYNSSTVIAYDLSRVTACDSSTVIAYSSSTVTAFGSSTVTAHESSTVIAYGSSRVTACDSSRVTAYDSSTVEAYNSSTVIAYDLSTVIAYGSSTVRAYGSSTVRAYDLSTVAAYNLSTVTAYLASVVRVHGYNCDIKAYDNTHLYFMINTPKRNIYGDSVTAKHCADIKSPTFEEWLERGVLYADGIYQTIKNKKTIGDVTIYETCQGFAAQKGNKFAHGKTLEQAKNDLKYKLSDRDTSKYASWNLNTKCSLDEMIECYMTITGACSFGTKQFCESSELKDEYTIKEVIEITKGRYGNEEFEHFFRGAIDE